MLLAQSPKYITTNNCNYSNANLCIYCGSTENLTDEHIIPYGLGGRWVLPKASCSECSKITSKFENNCLKKMYGPTRNLLGIPSRKDGILKKVLIETKTKYLIDTIEEIPLSKYPPFLVECVMEGIPPITLGLQPQEGKENSFAARIQIIRVKNVSTPHFKTSLVKPFSTIDFAKMISKIALGYAFAKLGADGFRPHNILLNLIRNVKPYDPYYLIGRSVLLESKSQNLHEVEIEKDCDKKGNQLIVVRVRLFSQFNLQSNRIVVGYDGKCNCNNCKLNQ